jgi:general secretion pathway protein G
MTHAPAVATGSGRWTVRYDAGFTLVELMMAVTVLGVLAALGSLSYASYRERVDIAKAVHELAALSTTIDMFVLDNRRLPDDLDEAGLAGRLDPWGREYVYLPLLTAADRGRARKDRRLVPINSDYDLYSVGKDGESRGPLTASQSHDDVIRAGSGSFLGKAEDF